MISDIQSKLNTSSDKQSNASKNTNLISQTGTIARLSNEMKLIESLSLIKFLGSEAINFQGKPAQLLHATSAQHPFTLINTGKTVDIGNVQHAKMARTNTQQATITLANEAPIDKSHPSSSQPINTGQKIDNLMMASRVINLTVISIQNQAQGQAVQSKSTSTVAGSTPSSSNHAERALPSNETVRMTSSPTDAKNLSQNVYSTIAKQTTTPNVALPTATGASGQINSTPQTQLATVSDGQSEFAILSQTPLKKGDTLRVMVDANKNMQVLPSKTPDIPTSIQSEALKQSLPRQLSLGDMSQLINQLQRLNEAPAGNLTPQTQQALKQLLQSLPQVGSLTQSPEIMKQAIQTSGVFSESLLLSDNKTHIPADLKLNLTRLKEAQDTIPNVRVGGLPTEQIANAIERITTGQLRHFSDNNMVNAPSYPLHIELPIKYGQNTNFVQIEINKDTSAEDKSKQDRRWLVKLKFDFEETGRFDARTSIQANKVGIIFAAENPDTVQKIQKNMPALKQQLKEKDIEVERLDAFQAKLDKDKAPNPNTQTLIDVRT